MCRRSPRQCIARLIRLRSTLHPPPGSGDFASMILRPEKFITIGSVRRHANYEAAPGGVSSGVIGGVTEIRRN
jgi:hypothetical protein